MTIRKWQNKIHQLACEKGWWHEMEDTEDRIPEALLLIHAEISEATEDYRSGNMDLLHQDNGKPIGFPSELADAVIRILDLCDALDIDLEHIIALKHEYNKTRSYKHGNKRI